MGVFRQFPYSNFHEMNMDELIKIVKTLSEDWVAYQLKWGKLYDDTEQALEDFKAYVQNYWNTLDLTDEVNTVLIKMVNQGTFDPIIRTQLSPVVTSWLEDNITIPEGVVIDKSLSIEGACADALVVGENLRDYNSIIINDDDMAFPSNVTRNGITFTSVTPDPFKKFHAQGACTADFNVNVISGSATNRPSWFVPGDVLYFDFPSFEDVYYQVYCYYSDSSRDIFRLTKSSLFRVPVGTVGCFIQLNFKRGAVVDDDMYLHITNSAPNNKIFDTDLANELFKYNAFVVSEDSMLYPSNLTRNGLNFTTSEDTYPFKKYHVSGTCTDTFSLNIMIGSETSKPDWFKAGGKQYVDVPTIEGCYYRFFCYFEGGGRQTFDFASSGVLSIPNGTIGLYIQVYFNNGASFDHDMYCRITNAIPNILISEEGGGSGDVIYNITNIENTYSVTASPTITQGNLYFLAPNANPDTDVTNDIVSILASNKTCHLGTGVYTVSNLVIDTEQTLIGSGKGTIIKLNPSVGDGYAVKLKWKSAIKDCQIVGGDTDYYLNDNVGNRHGIMFEGTLNNNELSDLPRYCEIDNVFVSNFSGSGLCCRFSGTPEFTNLQVINSRFMNNAIGVNIASRSEYHNFANCSINRNHIGVVNNGGNNTFVNCNISRNITGVLMDSENGANSNNSHGAMVGCKINHNGANNDGIAIKMIGQNNGFVFSACNIWYGSIDIASSKGIVFNGMKIGDQVIRINNASTVFFNGCNWRNAPSFSKDLSSVLRVDNCYTESGSAINA